MKGASQDADWLAIKKKKRSGHGYQAKNELWSCVERNGLGADLLCSISTLLAGCTESQRCRSTQDGNSTFRDAISNNLIW